MLDSSLIVTHVVETHDPVVDDDLRIDPTHVLVQEEGHVVFVLTVKVFLCGHLVSFGFRKQHVLDDRNAEHLFSGFTIGDGQYRVLSHYQTSYSKLCYGHVDVLFLGHLGAVTEFGTSVGVEIGIVCQYFVV